MFSTSSFQQRTNPLFSLKTQSDNCVISRPKSVWLQDHDSLKMWQFKMSADIPQFQDGSSAKVTFSWTWVQCELEGWESGFGMEESGF